MGILIVVEREVPFGVGAPSVGDMTEFGAVDVNVQHRKRGRPACWPTSAGVRTRRAY